MIEVIPLNVGNFVALEKSILTYLKDPGMGLRCPVIMWYLRGTPEHIIVDTGPADPAWAAQYHHPMERQPHQEVTPALASVNIRPEDVRLVVNTHLHWDHCYGNYFFPRAEFVVQRAELEYAENPLPCQVQAYEAQWGIPPLRQIGDRLRLVEGDAVIASGVSVCHLPGHTPGSQGVLVEAGHKRVLIAGDTVPLWENWEATPHIPPGLHADLAACYASLNRVGELADLVLPGHDMRVFEKSSYP